MKTLIINSHPDKSSFTASLANVIYKNFPDGELLNLHSLKFNPIFLGYGKGVELEDDLNKAQEQIKEADHIIIVTPIWWSTYPALLKGFFDRVLTPHFAFRYTKGKLLPEKLLLGKTAELFLLSDAPSWYRKFIMNDPAAKILKRDILGFCGIKVTKIHRIGSMNKRSEDEKKALLKSLTQHQDHQ